MRINKETGLYASPYAIFSTAGHAVEKIRIPVENAHFSTLSTAFSTASFHSSGKKWIYKTVNIIKND